jgi:hypothetical protein
MTDGEVIVSLGGPSEVSRRLGLPVKTVGNWNQINRRIPWKYRSRVAELLLLNGKFIPAGFIGGTNS